MENSLILYIKAEKNAIYQKEIQTLNEKHKSVKKTCFSYILYIFLFYIQIIEKCNNMEMKLTKKSLKIVYFALFI